MEDDFRVQQPKGSSDAGFSDSRFSDSRFDPAELKALGEKAEVEKVSGQSSETIRMTKQLLTEHFSENRERLWRTIQTRMDPRLYGRVDPDDILQEAYLDAIKRVGHFAEEVNYTPFVWLRLIVGQTLINVHRRHLGAKKRDASRERSINRTFKYEMSASTEAMAFQLAASQTSPSEALVRSEEVAELASAISGLTDIDREILTLRHFEDLSNKEVAELLQIEQKAASIRYVRAIQRLKKCLGNTDFKL